MSPFAVTHCCLWMSDEEIQDIVMTVNLTPRKCLGFLTPFQAITKELGKDVQIRFA
ncbi:hypothetical protein OGR47_18910 (plasmid) [Methylocystis sp. MJC1]|uniref:hypothetical protein n=1 Tax=Methylocystis sp. MJC1 TaxID=2654282 RepID=UPI0013EB38EA|nr:hypothetical protein [Methylocystis sp. MJC1]MBU6529027.1 hypothetical protein [Methylocystis sp. MJC1]UZX13972.1 hypothetical protein OGR47_18910 [Methylocystis sp. MJC1]